MAASGIYRTTANGADMTALSFPVATSFKKPTRSLSAHMLHAVLPPPFQKRDGVASCFAVKQQESDEAGGEGHYRADWLTSSLGLVRMGRG